MAGVSIRNLTRHPVPRLPFAETAKAVLPGWEISLVFIGEARAKKLNASLRRKNYVPNVLSYPAGAKSGEILICPPVARKQAPAYKLPPDAYLLFLFIHGLLHLKGARHGVTMERSERELLARFAKTSPRTSLLHGTTHRNRNRHRDLPGKTGRRRRGSR